ncbi:uncharacterized protein K460DRAFT_426717 [Cucurbitaria berberidis CBS 394.84]|uniref:Uncharacterized protein n=1 Tax=Cucurbitaria berberidis CBS 394.84 TaxID=1168544 RepID=A0A9P4LB55_9PLEO|nr:uncharacterized protein K460DRAFT_426717 [Cucurbitaria berberidis CBS 394.84]KAF1847864.1 hypothetical protein K460DRAFT_426717 [Cucurbitaria berberidis CBS 394.84]
MSNHNMNNPTEFENLPPELMNAVLEELLGTSDNPGPRLRHRPDIPELSTLERRFTMETAILRTNKQIHAMAKAYLDLANKWIVFDMDDVHLVLPWACILIPMTIIDPEANYAVPEGIMRVRVKLCLNGERIIRPSPASQPKRQLVLIKLEHFVAFLAQIRMAELINSVRVMPRAFFIGDNQGLYNAMKGFNGLKIRVHVDPNYPHHWMQALLDCFDMFHGPLNEVSIIGSFDAQQARRIETSIALPRNVAEPTMYEIYIHIAHRIKLANHFADQGQLVSAIRLYDRVRNMTNASNTDRTPWSGWSTKDWSQFPFEALLITVATLNALIISIGTQENLEYAHMHVALHHSLVQQISLLLDFDDLGREMEGWILLLSGLHYILHARVVGTAYNGPERLLLVRIGMNLLEDTIGTFEHLPERDNVGFRAATYMCTRLRVLDFNPDKTLLFSAITRASIFFANRFEQYSRPVRWCVHQSLIPQALVNRGIVEHMQNCSRLTEEQKNQLLLVKVFEDDAEGGDDYFM